MADQEDFPRRIARQFSDDEDRAAVWRALDLVLDTSAYLNLGYSRWYQSHLVGNPQRRLVDEVGRNLSGRLSQAAGTSLLDVGCGRGGPAVRLARRHGFAVTGIDLVPHNVRLARDNAQAADVPAAFLVGAATHLPVRSESVAACTAIDAPVYVPDKRRFYAELARVLEPGGVAVVSDLVATDGLAEADRAAVETFADAWDMPSLPTRSDYRSVVEESALEGVELEDISANSVARFDRWARLFLWVATGPFSGILRRFFASRGVDLDAVIATVRDTMPALPHLRHVVVHAGRPR